WNITAAPVLDPFVAYRAQVVISVAGFESVANIDAGPDFIATQMDVNNAIIAAINANPEGRQLIEAELGTCDQDLWIYSLIDGVNQASLTIRQPQRVAGTPAAGTAQIQINAGDVQALAAALLKTGVAATSTDIYAAGGDANALSAADIATYFGAGAADDDYTGTYTTFYAGGYDDGGNTGGQANNSVINMGSGANDLAILSSNVDSVNTLVFNAVWGKVSVVNFFDAATTAVMLENGPGNQVNGNHLLDFTAFLTNSYTGS